MPLPTGHAGKNLLHFIRGERNVVDWLSHSISHSANECGRHAMPSALSTSDPQQTLLREPRACGHGPGMTVSSAEAPRQKPCVHRSSSPQMPPLAYDLPE